MPWLPLLGLVLAATIASVSASVSASGAAPGATPERGQTAAERLHRKGVRCMDVIERPECAIESFEALLDEDTRQRELVTDALLRLLTLYRRTGRTDEIAPVLRRFWEAGGGRRSSGHVPYSLRYVPGQLDMVLNIDPPHVLASALLERGGADLRDYLFTCDEIRRHDIELQQRWRRAAQQAAAEGKPTWEVFYAKLDAEHARDRKRRAAAQERAQRDPDAEPGRPPLVLELACPLVDALGLPDNGAWRRMTGASHHEQRDQTVAIFQLDGLEPRLRAAVEAGRLVEDGPGRWRLPKREPHDALDLPPDVRLVSLDHDELLAAPLALLPAIEEASLERKRSMSRALQRLIDDVPRDTGMFVVLDQTALRELGFGGMERRSLRSVLEAVLPRPKGLQAAVVMGDAMVLLTRVPTDTAVRGRMLVTLANAMLARNADKDAEAAKWIEDLDVAEASDRKALLASYLVSAARLEEILWD